MKKLNGIITAAIFSIIILSSCGVTSSCENEEIGHISLSERADKFLLYPDKEIVIFIDQDGEQLIFSNTLHENQSTIYAGENGTKNDFIHGSISCNKYYSTKSKENYLQSQGGNYYLSMRAIPTLKKQQIHFTAQDINNQEGVYGVYNFEDGDFEQGDNPLRMFDRLEEVELNGKTFTDIYRIAESDNEIYFKEREGIVGFSIKEKVWILAE